MTIVMSNIGINRSVGSAVSDEGRYGHSACTTIQTFNTGNILPRCPNLICPNKGANWALRSSRRNAGWERLTEFIANWWQHKFSMDHLPTDDDVIMLAHALELLTAYQKACDARWKTAPTAKSFLEVWWQRKFPADPPKHGSVLRLADAKELLIAFRKSTRVPCG